MATLSQLKGTLEAASELGITDGRVRQILRRLDSEGRPIGQKLRSGEWLLTSEDIEAIRQLPDKRKKSA